MKINFVKLKDHETTLYINLDNVSAINKERCIVYVARSDVLFISQDAMNKLIELIER